MMPALSNRTPADVLRYWCGIKNVDAYAVMEAAPRVDDEGLPSNKQINIRAELYARQRQLSPPTLRYVKKALGLSDDEMQKFCEHLGFANVVDDIRQEKTNSENPFWPLAEAFSLALETIGANGLSFADQVHETLLEPGHKKRTFQGIVQHLAAGTRSRILPSEMRAICDVLRESGVDQEAVQQIASFWEEAYETTIDAPDPEDRSSTKQSSVNRDPLDFLSDDPRIIERPKDFGITQSQKDAWMNAATFADMLGVGMMMHRLKRPDLAAAAGCDVAVITNWSYGKTMPVYAAFVRVLAEHIVPEYADMSSEERDEVIDQRQRFARQYIEEKSPGAKGGRVAIEGVKAYVNLLESQRSQEKSAPQR